MMNTKISYVGHT